MNPYYKTTKGYNAKVIVGKQVEYSAQATYALFVANSVEGEIGVFNATTNALVSGLGAVAAGTKVFIAQKRDNAINSSIPFAVVSGVASYTAYVAPVKDKWTVDSSAVGALVKGDVLEIGIVELTKGAGKYHVWNFDETVTAADTLTTVLTRLAARISDVNAKENYAFGQLVNASVVADDLVLEASETSRFFRVLLRQKLEGVTLTHTASAKLGSGTYEGVASVEAEGHIFDGVTTNYPGDGMANPEDYGVATKFAVPGVTYDVVLFSPWIEEASPLPMHKHTHKNYIFLALPASGAATPTAELKLIFGF